MPIFSRAPSFERRENIADDGNDAQVWFCRKACSHNFEIAQEAREANHPDGDGEDEGGDVWGL